MTKSVALCAAILAFSFSLNAQTVGTIDPALKSRIDQIAAGIMKQREVPSASIAVVKAGKLVYTHAYGLAHISPDKPATPEMRYAIGSNSKQFTAAAILLLQEQGKLTLDDPVGKYIPGLTRGDEVTIRQILSHTAGYQDYAPEDYPIAPMEKPITPLQIIDTWAKKPLDFEPGTQWQYSNTNYVIAGLIVEKLSGQTLFGFLQQHIFAPLGMKSVWNYNQRKLPSSDAIPYYRVALGPLRPAPLEGSGWLFGSYELAMTAHDLAIWDASLFARSILKPESYNQMFTSVKTKDGKDTHYGLGVDVTDRNGHRAIEHGGEANGFVSDNLVYVDDGVAVAVLTNHMEGGASQIAGLTADTMIGAKLSPSEEQALNIYRGLQKGQIDRSLLAPNLNDYFSSQALADFKESLGPLREPLTFHQTRETLRGGMTFRAFRIVYPTRRLSLSTYTYPDGKLEQYLVGPAD